MRRNSIVVQHIPTGVIYSAILVDDRDDGTCIFILTGEDANQAKKFCQSSDLEVDTLFEPTWRRIKEN